MFAVLPALTIAVHSPAVTQQIVTSNLAVDSLPSLRIPIQKLVDWPHRGVILGDGSILLILRNGHSLVGFDSTGRQRWKLDITPQGSGGFASFSDLLPLSTDRVAIWDLVLNRLTEVDDGGRPRGRRQVAALPRVEMPGGGRAAQALRIHGRLGSDELLATTTSDPKGGEGLRHDSVKVIRADRGGSTTVIDTVLHAQQFWRTDPYLVQGRLPFGRAGSIAVWGDAWYYTDGERFRIERRNAHGGLLSTFGTNRPRRPVTPESIRQSRLDVLAESDSTLKPSVIRALAATPYPDSMAAYAQLEFDDTGMLWARESGPAWESSRWDLFSHTGRPLGQVVVPARLRVLHIAADALLAYYQLPGETHELRVYPLRRIR